MWPNSDRSVAGVIKLLERRQEDDKNEKRREQAEKHFKMSLEKLWPLKSNEKPS